VVAATAAEVAPLVSRLRDDGPPQGGHDDDGSAEAGPHVRQYASGPHEIDVLVTGVGMVATAAWTSRELARARHNAAFNFGVCGSFNRALAPGTVVHVASDRFAELGAEDGDTFLTIQQMRLIGDDDFPFQGGRLVNVTPPEHGALRSLPVVDGITVNTVHGNERSIACVVERFTPDVESMEGAGFMYACLIHGIPFAQVRAVSNIVERRNRDGWQLDLAITRLGEVAWQLLEA
jgi:futalosine hydrolase